MTGIRIAIALMFGLLLSFHQSDAAEQGPDTKSASPSASPLVPQDNRLFEDANNLIEGYNGTGDSLERAFKILTDLAQRYPHSGYPIAGLANLRYRLAKNQDGPVQEALVLAQRALQQDPKIAVAYVVTAKVMIDQGNSGGAQQAADRAIALAPQSPAAMYVKARAADRGERYDEAVQWYRRAIDVQTDRRQKAILYGYMGDVYKGMTPRDIPNATAAWVKAVEFADDQSPWTLNNAGNYFMMNTDRFDLALDCLNRALKITDFGAARMNLALAMYYKWGDAYMNPGKYKNAKRKPDDPRTIAAKTGVRPEAAFLMNATSSITPWTTIAMIRAGMIKNVDIVVDPSTGTALTSAAWANHFDVVKLLIEKGANVNGRDNDMGNTAIFYAVENRNLDMVKFLFVKGARLNIVNGAKKPLITHAVENAKRDDIRIVTYLLEKGADPSLPDQNGNALITTAVMNGNAQAARLLLQKHKADPNVKWSGNGFPILAMAAVSSGKSSDMVKVLLEGGANPWVKYGQDVLAVLAGPTMDSKIFPSAKENLEMIQAARQRLPKPADFGRAYGEK